MQDLVVPNLTTILIEFIPPVVLTSAYLFYIISNRERRNIYIEAFILIVFARVITFFLRVHIYPSYPIGGFDPTVDLGTLITIFLSNFVYHIGGALQDYMTWIMVSFYSALFCFFFIIIRLLVWERKGSVSHLKEWKEKSDLVKLSNGQADKE